MKTIWFLDEKVQVPTKLEVKFKSPTNKESIGVFSNKEYFLSNLSH